MLDKKHENCRPNQFLINRFTALEAAQNEVTQEDLWKGTKTVLLEVARETIGSVVAKEKEMDI